MRLPHNNFTYVHEWMTNSKATAGPRLHHSRMYTSVTSRESMASSFMRENSGEREMGNVHAPVLPSAKEKTFIW